jgi:glycosyltransferase involved in cell wall biosynthesis
MQRLRLAPRATDGLVVLSERIATWAVQRGWARSRVGVIPGAVDTDRFRPREPSDALRSELGLSSGERVLGVVARIQPHRRFDLLLDAIDRTRRIAPGLRLLVVGRGTRARPVLEEPVRSRGLERQVLRAGYRREDYRDVLSLMDALLFLVPGSDGSCRAVLEAMAMGVPTIATRRGILPEIVVDGETGRLVDEDPDALAAAMLDVWRDPEAWALRGKAARARAAASYTLETQAERLERFYAELCGAS